MRQRTVVFAPEANEDLQTLYDWIAATAGPGTAIGYIERLESYCLGLSQASERGRRRSDVREHMRVVGFEGRVTIAFTVEAETVTILRVFHGGRDWERDFH